MNVLVREGYKYNSLDINQGKYRWNRNITHLKLIKEGIDGIGIILTRN